MYALLTKLDRSSLRPYWRRRGVVWLKRYVCHGDDQAVQVAQVAQVVNIISVRCLLFDIDLVKQLLYRLTNVLGVKMSTERSEKNRTDTRLKIELTGMDWTGWDDLAGDSNPGYEGLHF